MKKLAKEDIGLVIEQLLEYGIYNDMMDTLDRPLARNQIMSLLKVEEPYEGVVPVPGMDTPLPILTTLLDYACEQDLIEDNTTQRDLLDSKIMGCLMPRQGELFQKYSAIRQEEGKEAATDFFYKLSQDSNYIRMDRVSKNRYWTTDTKYGELEITINLSKPEKDPKEIAKAKEMPQASYPKCLLCLENVGYEGRLNHPGRANHRVLPVTLNNEDWYFQYSPYVYYNEHSIILKGKHEPMKIQKETFIRLLDFVEQVPHYFLGSNADLPIVGGSILSHDHFQGGRHIFAMEEAKVVYEAKHKDYPGIKAGIVNWPLSVLRLSSASKEELVELSDEILGLWRAYSDESAGIHAFSGETPHNTITPIARMNKEGLFEMDLVLRNNRQDGAHPDGIFHPSMHLHHIKKENIGLIEVMGLAVLPARLDHELEKVKSVLTGKTAIDGLTEEMQQHIPWIMKLMEEYGTENTAAEAESIITQSVGMKFMEVLECAGVYKTTEEGINAFKAFLQHCGF